MITLNCQLVGGPACGRQMRMASEAGDVPGMAIVDDPRGQQHLYVQDLDDPSRFIYARSKHMVQRQASEMIGPVHGLRP